MKVDSSKHIENKKFAYIGTLNKGGTCLMRGKVLEKILPDSQAYFVDTLTKIKSFNRIFQSLAFRYKLGPVIPAVNRYIHEAFKNSEHFKFIWVDKAIYLSPRTTRYLKSKCDLLIHFTPDTAFYANRSRYFYRSIKYYDFVITTKSYDLESYLKFIHKDKLLLCTQGFDPGIHIPYFTFKEKMADISFIGLYEEAREEMLQLFLDHNLSVRLGGFGWESFIRKNSENAKLNYIGSFIRDEAYAEQISAARFSPGLLSKKFPELHTTRTFEIPACGTALLTEENEETAAYFNKDEVLFYHSYDDLLNKINYFLQRPSELESMIEKGRQRVIRDGRDYESILRKILMQSGILS